MRVSIFISTNVRPSNPGQTVWVRLKVYSDKLGRVEETRFVGQIVVSNRLLFLTASVQIIYKGKNGQQVNR